MGTLAKFKQTITDKKLLQTPYYKISFEGGQGAVSDDFNLFCQALDIPGRKLSVLEVKRHGFTLRMPNVVEYDGTMKATIIVSLDLDAYKQLIKWQKTYSDLTKNAGGTRGFPASNAKISILDENFKDGSSSIKVFGIFPSEVPSLSMKQDASEYVTADCTFTYSYTSDWSGTDDLLKGGK